MDLVLTLAPLAHGKGDPTARSGPREVTLALRTPDGSASLALEERGNEITVRAWGRGAARMMDSLSDLIGRRDRPETVPDHHPVVRALKRRYAGARMTRTGCVMHALVPAILEQKVAGAEARRSYRRLVLALGEPAPGPLGLVAPPAPERLAALPYYAFHRFGIERRRAETLMRACALASRLEATADMPTSAARARLTAVPGIGAWTAAEVARVAFGDPDAVSLGDYNLPSLVTWALAREPRGNDPRMLELLEPYAGQRARIVRWLELAGMWPPRRAPRRALRAIERV